MITDVQILAIIICSVMSYLAFKLRIPPLTLIPSAGFCIIGIQIYQEASDFLILALFIMLALTVSIITYGRRRA